ncbi:hypothetical protein FGRMN_7709 [Fusarium graminum]|nr:hypothetical protein FGRMN_7709 [Fusarium graminum]
MSQPATMKGEPSGDAKPGNAKGKGKGKNNSKGSKPDAKPAPKPQGTEKKEEKKEEKKKEKGLKTFARDCAVLFGDSGPVVASSPSFGLGSRIVPRMGRFIASGTDPYLGVHLSILRDPGQEASEASGFGVCHDYDRGSLSILPADLKIIVKFPRDKVSCSFDGVPLSVQAKFPTIENWGSFTYMTVRLQDGASPKINGYGLPFANSSDKEIDAWVNDNAPISGDATLLDVLHQRSFFFVVSSPLPPCRNELPYLPPAFDHGYGTWQPVDETDMKELISKNLGGPFEVTHGFDAIESHLTVVNQSTIQDLMWVHEEAQEIADTQFRAYFVTPETGTAAEAHILHLVVPLTKEWRDLHDPAWRRLTKNDIFMIRLYDVEVPNGEKCKPAKWACRIIEWPSGIPALGSHPTEDHELVLRVRCDHAGPDVIIRHFGDRATANAALKEDKHNPVAVPSNPKIWDVPLDENGRIPEVLDTSQELALDHAMFRMDVHRALLCGTGFFDLIVRVKTPDSLEERLAATNLDSSPGQYTVDELPFTNFLDIEDKAYVDCIIDEALPQDRARFRGYLSHRVLDLGLITAPPGFGKTTAGAAAALAMQAKLGQILCSAPTHVAVDNFASRIDKTTRAIAARYNQDKGGDGATRSHHRFVIRVYGLGDELMVFKRLLEKPDAVDSAANKGQFVAASRWKLHLSLAYWLLVLLRSPVVPPLASDDSKALHGLQQVYDNQADLSGLREVATGKKGWKEFSDATADVDKMIKGLMTKILEEADFLCTTPANVDNKPLCDWRATRARGLAVDEAGNMHRADLYGLWGNTLLPCFLIGDPRQLPPTVMTTNEKDAAGNLLNRFAAEGVVSPLAYFQAIGIPVYRLKTQLRMADGMFDSIAKIIYPDVPFDYGPGCRITLPEHKIGVDVDAFFCAKFPDCAPSPAGKLRAIFVHCKGSRVFTDPRTMSKKSPDQVKVALDLLVELVQAKKIDVTRIVCIAPYAANVGLINKELKGRAYQALAGMQEASTVDSFQGQENDLAVLVMGTAHPHPGPGFTSNAKRLNVMLSRQKSALVIVGDITVAQPSKTRIAITDELTGDTYFVTVNALNSVYQDLVKSKRVVTVVVEGKGKGKGKGKAKGDDKEEAKGEAKGEA